jgi:hypothetical protein
VTPALDYQPLVAPFTREQVRVFRDAARADGRPWASISITQALGIIAAIPVVIVVALLLGSIIANAAVSGPPIVPYLLVGFVVVVAVLVLRQMFAVGSHWERWARLDAFARANGLVFSPRDAGPGYPGMIFGLGTDRVAQERLTRTADPFLDFANYRYTTGSGKSRTTHDWGYLALKLERRLPNMVLDSRSNNLLFGTNLPSTFDRSQVLKLEGDFNEHFTLYCPTAYERDALYVFTPDLMALLIDVAAPFDVELVDDWMFVYSATRFELTDAATVQRLFRIVDTVGATTLSQTDRYADERIGDRSIDLVAPAGARLKRGIPVVAIVVGVVFAVVWAWGFFGDLVG